MLRGRLVLVDQPANADTERPALKRQPFCAEQAHCGEVGDTEFIGCIRISPPYAWSIITGLIADLHSGDAEFANNQVPAPDETARGQLLRLMASDAMRAAIECHYDIKLAFQNCHPRRRLPPRRDPGTRRVHHGPLPDPQPAARTHRLLTASPEPQLCQQDDLHTLLPLVGPMITLWGVRNLPGL